MTQETLKLALEALEENHHLIEEHERPEYLVHYDQIISLLAKALAKEKTLQALHSENERLGLYKDAYAQPEQEPVAWMDADGNVSDNNDHKCFPIPLYTTPPQRTEQESVAWGVDWGKAGDIACVSIIKRLPNDVIEVVAVEYAPYSYTTPPQEQQSCDKRTWVALTTADQKEIQRQSVYVEGAIRMTETKLKEKNT